MGSHSTRAHTEQRRALREASAKAGHQLNKETVHAIVAELHRARWQLEPLGPDPSLFARRYPWQRRRRRR